MSCDFDAPDTLVLKLCQYDERDVLDTSLYIIYDDVIDKYVIRGKRNSKKCMAFSFQCEKMCSLIQFINFIIPHKMKYSIMLYNYDNLPATSNEITFQFLELWNDRAYEISGYDSITEKKDIKKCLKILKNVYNVNH
jgi:hypothetical protein